MFGSRLFLAYHQITREEYDNPSYVYYVWAEPYGSAAFAHAAVHSGLAVGRLKLSSALMPFKGQASARPNLPGSIHSDDRIIEFNIMIVNSVAQFIADEMNNNQGYHKLDEIHDHMREADRLQALHDSGQDPRMYSPRAGHRVGPTYADLAEAQRDNAFYDYGHIVHADPHPNHNVAQRASQLAQEAIFLGGGEWDHKPRIFAVWGSSNRLGNSADVYQHDLWSNIHYGFMGRHCGFSLERLVGGAAIAQIVDNFTGSDDPVDQQCTEAGFNLYGRGQRVTYSDLVRIVQRHPNWIDRIRYP